MTRAYRAVVFDYDGTLFDTRPAIAHSIRRAFEQSGRPVPPQDLVVAAISTGGTLHDTLQSVAGGLLEDAAALKHMELTYRSIYLAESAALLRPFAGVVDALQELHAASIRCVVVSNKGIAAIRQSLAHSRLDGFVDFVFGDEPGLPKKPDAAIVSSFILPRYADLQRTELLVVGDTETDIALAQRSGVASCWVSYGYGEPDRCRALHPDYEIGGIAELPALVSGTRS
jgi:phosphoglycolate phosphatase